jgi:hypothetical protein
MEKLEKKKDILEDVKELDRKVRAKVVYEKISDIKEWAKEISTLKQKTQLLLEELGVETEDIKRLIDYATNSPEAQLTKSDLDNLRESVKDIIKDSKKKAQKKIEELPMVTTGYTTGGMSGASWTISNTSGINTIPSANMAYCSNTGGTDNIDFRLK